MMEEGEPEVHTTELTALSAAEKIVWQDELTSPITSVEGPDFVMEVQPGLANDSETKTIWNTDNQQQQQIQQQPMRFQPFFKTISADSSFLPNASSLQDSRAFFFSPTLKTASDEDTSLLSSFPLPHPLTLKTASADDDTSLFSSLPLPTLKTASDDDTSILSSLPHPLPLPLNTASADNDTSLLSSLPDFSASKRSSLEFTAAWVASTPFSDAPKTPSAASTPPDNDGVRVDASVDASGFDANEGTAAEPLPSYVAIKNPTATTTTSKMTAATMIGSMSGRKIRPTTTMMMGIAQQQQQQRQQQLCHHQSHLVTKAEQNVKNSAQNQPQFLANHHHHPQFITPTVSVTRFPTTAGPTSTSGGNNNNNIVTASQFSSSQQRSPAHFFVPAVVGASTTLESNVEVGPPRIPLPTSIMYDSTTTRATMTTSNHHLGRHWKQMGCHTRQYVRPSIPLPASIRLASAAKQLRVAGGKGATSLGGPPGSLSPLTPNKSWAQVVASSTPQQKKQQNQQANNPMINNTSEMIVPNNNNGPSLHFVQQLSSSKSAATPLPHGAAVAYNKVAAMPPPPLFSGNNVGCGKPVKSASLRGLAGLGGVSTSSNRDFKSLLLRLKTVLEKEKEKWRPKAFVSGFGVVGGGGGGLGGGGDGDNGIGVNIMEEASWPSSIKPCRGSIDGKQRAGDGGGGDGDNGSIKPCRGSIDGKQRDECIFWLAWILRKLQFSAETMALSVALFDALIAAAVGKSDSITTTTTTTKYPQMIVTTGNCKLVALVCLLLSAKFSEEDSDVPTTKDFLRVSEINNGVGVGSSSSVDGSSSSAVGVVTVEMALKMERIILTALEWDLNRPTPLKFLEILHTLLLCHQPQLLEDVALNLTPAKHLQRLTWKMQKIVANHQLALSYRPAVLAVSLLSIDLESIGVADWQVVSQALEKICLIGGVHSGTNLWGEDRHKISRCKNLIVRLLDSGVDRNITSSGTTTTTTSGGGGGVHSGASAVASALDGGGDRTKDKRSTIKLKRKHVPSESGGGGGGGSGGFAADNVNVTRERGLRPSNASSAATFSSSTTTSSVSSTSSSSRTTLKRVFNIAESPSCKSEARSDEEARGGGLSAAERFQALQGLCINIY